MRIILITSIFGFLVTLIGAKYIISYLNKIGLLAKILEQFDVRDIDKTSTLAQKNPDGGCTIIIGIYEKSEAALEAERVIRSW